MSYSNLLSSLMVTGFHSTPWKQSFCRCKNEFRKKTDWRSHHALSPGGSTSRCVCLAKKRDSSSETLKKAVTKAESISESIDLIGPEQDDAAVSSTDDFIALEDPDLLNDLLDTDTSDYPSSTLPVISLDNIDLLTESGTSNIAYFYLQNEIGLSEESMWRITHEAGQVLGMTADTLRRKVDLLRRTMDLTDEDVRTLLERQPTILQLSADQNLAPTILFLVRALDLSKADLRSMVIQFPCILCYSTRNLKSKLNFFTRLMGYSTDECRKLLVSEPKLLTAGVRTGLLPHLRFFTSDLDIRVEKLRPIIKKNPLLLLYSLEDNLVPKLIFYLTMNLRMDSKQVLRLLTKYPQLVDYNLENHILPITAYLMQELEFSPIEVRQILLSFPRLVSHSLRKIKHVVGYLRFELGLEPAQVKRVLYQAPQAIGLNTETNLKQKVSFLRDSLQLTNNELRSVIAGMPTLLICSIESNLKPKIEYLSQVFGNAKDLREAIVTMPALLGYSLEKRIKPRMERLLAIGGHPRGITIGIPMKDEAFDGWLTRRQKRLEKNAGFDQKPRRKGAEQQGAIVHVAAEKNKEEGDGRITHWTRERRPPSQR
jgi:hypothetical protein